MSFFPRRLNCRLSGDSIPDRLRYDGYDDRRQRVESTYNAIASTDAAEDGILNGLGATWTAITSTLSGSTYTDASTNAPTYAGVPIFNTAGQLILQDGINIYSTSVLPNPIDYTNNGSTSHWSYVWTGGDTAQSTGGIPYDWPLGKDPDSGEIGNTGFYGPPI